MYYDAKADWRLRNATRYIGQQIMFLADDVKETNYKSCIWSLAHFVTDLESEAIRTVRLCANVAFEVTSGKPYITPQFLNAGGRPTNMYELAKLVNDQRKIIDGHREAGLIYWRIDNILSYISDIHRACECLLITPYAHFDFPKGEQERIVKRAASVAKWLKDVERYLSELGAGKSCWEKYNGMKDDGDE